MEDDKFDFDKEHTEPVKSSRKPLTIVTIVILLLVILGGGYLLFSHSSSNLKALQISPTPVVQQGLAPGNSDTALNQDEAQINSQLNQLDQDLQSVDSSFSHQSQETVNASSNNY